MSRFALEYKTTPDVRYDTDLNQRVEEWLAKQPGVTVLETYGGTDMTTQVSDNGFTIEADSVATAFRLAEEIERLVGSKVSVVDYDVEP